MKRWIYRGDRPRGIARVLNRFWARQYAAGRLARARDVTLEVRGRSSGKTILFPVVMADYRGDWYLVSMLGENANWVRNVRAADGRAVLRHGAAHEVELQEVPVGQRAPILQRYLDVAPGARPHIPVDRAAPVEEFDHIASDFPAFKVVGRADIEVFSPAASVHSQDDEGGGDDAHDALGQSVTRRSAWKLDFRRALARSAGARRAVIRRLRAKLAV